MKMAPPTVVVTEYTRQQLLTVQEYAGLVRVHPLSVYRLIREKKQLGVVKVGRQIRINVAVALEVKPTHTDA